MQLVLQALIDLEANARSAPAATSALTTAPPTATEPVPAAVDQGGDVELAIPKLRHEASSPLSSSNLAGASTGPCGR